MATVVAMVGTMMLSVALVAINIAAPQSKELVAPPPKARVKSYMVRDTGDGSIRSFINVLGSDVDTVERAVHVLRQYVQGMQGFEGITNEGKAKLRADLAAVSLDIASVTSLPGCVALATRLQSIKAEWDKLKAAVVVTPPKTEKSKGASDDEDGFSDSGFGSDDDEY